MALVARGKLLNIKENKYDTQRGPAVDHVAELHQEGQEKSTPVLISWKIVDEVMLLIGKKVDCVLYLATKPKGKNGPWTQVIVVGVTEVK